MPKKFQGENTKSAAARARRAEAKAAADARKQKELEDAFWKDEDKHVMRKEQRKVWAALGCRVCGSGRRSRWKVAGDLWDAGWRGREGGRQRHGLVQRPGDGQEAAHLGNGEVVSAPPPHGLFLSFL